MRGECSLGHLFAQMYDHKCYVDVIDKFMVPCYIKSIRTILLNKIWWIKSFTWSSIHRSNVEFEWTNHLLKGNDVAGLEKISSWNAIGMISLKVQKCFIVNKPENTGKPLLLYAWNYRCAICTISVIRMKVRVCHHCHRHDMPESTCLKVHAWKYRGMLFFIMINLLPYFQLKCCCQVVRYCKCAIFT